MQDHMTVSELLTGSSGHKESRAGLRDSKGDRPPCRGLQASSSFRLSWNALSPRTSSQEDLGVLVDVAAVHYTRGPQVGLSLSNV
jgi:hypothetical protein